MKIVRLEAEAFKILRAVEIAPDGNIVTISGNNGNGKSSVLDAVWVALKGRAVAPPVPIRKGEEVCRIHLDLGDLLITRTFTAKEGGDYTDKLRVENSEGLRYGEPQKVLNALLGAIGFDPFAFTQLKAADQVARVLEMVPLPIDLEELAAQDDSDFLKRRDVNRDGTALKAQIEAMPVEEVPEEIPDRNALLQRLAGAAETNSAIEREFRRRSDIADDITTSFTNRDSYRGRAEALRNEAAELDEKADLANAQGVEMEIELAELPPLDEPVDTATLQEEIRVAENLAAAKARMDKRAELVQRFGELAAESKGYTEAMQARAQQRTDALAAAKMPVPGLGIGIDDKGKPYLTWEGLPFDKDQISTAAQLRVSVAIAMEANPKLRVLQIRDGSLLDDNSMKILEEMAVEQDFQIWCERVGTGGVGIVIEDGSIRGAETEPQPNKPKAKSKKSDPASEGTLV